MRAPTPSAAGELAVPDILEVKWKIENINKRLVNSLRQKLSKMKQRSELINNSKVLKNPYDMIEQNMLKCDSITKNLENVFNLKIKDEHIKLVALASRLDNLSPIKTMIRGYSIVEDEKGNIIKTVKSLKKEDKIIVKLSDGSVGAQII